MTAKEYLMQLQTLDAKITQKSEEAAQLRSVVEGRGMQINADRVQTSPQNMQEEVIVKYLDMEHKIDNLIDRYLREKDKIIDQIHQLTDSRFVRILYDRYVPDERHRVKSLEQIAVNMNYNYTYICELHGQALQAFSEMIRNNPK